MHRPFLLGFALSLFCAACATTGSSPVDDDDGGSSSPQTQTGVVTPMDGGSLEDATGRVTLQVPPGAVGTTIELTLDTEAATADTASDVFRFGPATIIFEVPATLRVSTQSLNAPADSELRLSRYDDGAWIALGDAVQGSGTIEAPVTTLGRFAVIVSEPDPSGPCDASCMAQPGAVCCTTCGCEAEVACQPTCAAGSGWDCEIGCCLDEGFMCVE